MHLNRLYTAVLACVALCLSAGLARAQQPGRVGIVVTVSVNVTEAEAQTFASALGEAIRSELEVDVIAGVETSRRLPEGGIPDECVASAECRSDLGRRLDADQLLMLVLIRLGDELQVDSTWAQVATGDSVSRPRITVGPDDVEALVLARSAPRLLPHIKKPIVAPAPKPEIIIVPQLPGKERGTIARRPIPLGTWISGGLSAASLASGVVFGLSARQTFESLEMDECRDRACDSARIASLRRRARTADLFLGASGLAAASALIFYFTGGEAKSSTSPSGFRLEAGPGDVGLSTTGVF